MNQVLRKGLVHYGARVEAGEPGDCPDDVFDVGYVRSLRKPFLEVQNAEKGHAAYADFIKNLFVVRINGTA